MKNITFRYKYHYNMILLPKKEIVCIPKWAYCRTGIYGDSSFVWIYHLIFPCLVLWNPYTYSNSKLEKIRGSQYSHIIDTGCHGNHFFKVKIFCMIILLFTKCIHQVVKNGFESDISFIVLTKFQKYEKNWREPP